MVRALHGSRALCVVGLWGDGGTWRSLSRGEAEAGLGLGRGCARPFGCCVQVFSATEGRVRIEQREGSSSFLIESAERGDEGRYTIKVTNPAGEDVASIFLRVVGEQSEPRGAELGVVPGGREGPPDSPASPPDVPDPPEAVRVTSVGEDWAVLVWEPPKYDGGQPLTGECLCAGVPITSDLSCPLTSP